MEEHGGTLIACDSGKAHLKRLHTVWSQPYGVLEKAQLWRQWTDQRVPSVWGEEGVNRWITKDLQGSETTLCETVMWIHVTVHLSRPTEHQEWPLM